MIHLKEGISAGYWTVSGAAETSAGRSLDKGAGGHYCTDPVTVVWPDCQSLKIKAQLSSLRSDLILLGDSSNQRCWYANLD